MAFICAVVTILFREVLATIHIQFRWMPRKGPAVMNQRPIDTHDVNRLMPFHDILHLQKCEHKMKPLQWLERVSSRNILSDDVTKINMP